MDPVMAQVGGSVMSFEVKKTKADPGFYLPTQATSSLDTEATDSESETVVDLTVPRVARGARRVSMTPTKPRKNSNALLSNRARLAKKHGVTIQAPSPIKRRRTAATPRLSTRVATPAKQKPITATIVFHDEDFLNTIVQRVSENIGELMVSYFEFK